jgi:hypothetical protein
MADGTNDSMPSPLSPQVSCRIFSSAKCPEVQRPTTVPGMPQPACICLLACLCLQANDADKYWQFSKLNHELSKNITLRGMLRFKPSPTGVCLGGGGGGRCAQPSSFPRLAFFIDCLCTFRSKSQHARPAHADARQPVLQPLACMRCAHCLPTICYVFQSVDTVALYAHVPCPPSPAQALSLWRRWSLLRLM